jgi:mono/diheme cytochrome c family protein
MAQLQSRQSQGKLSVPANSRKHVAALCFFMTCLWLSWCGAGLAADATDITEGGEIYEMYCGACHGFGGRALMPGTPSFSKGEELDKSVDELLDSIFQGKGDAMPSWEGVLSPTEGKQVLDFIFSLSDS